MEINKMKMLTDKIFIEKSEKIRLIIQQEIGLSGLINLIEAGAKVERFEKNNEVVLLVEEKDE